MADDVNALAQEYFDYLLTAWPTWGHLMGNYENADLYDDASRTGEDEEIRRRREFADRAEAIPVDDLSAQDLITREMIAFDGRRNADILDARFAEFAVDPIFGPVRPACRSACPKFPIPNADVAEAMIDKIRGIGEQLPRPERPRPRGRRPQPDAGRVRRRRHRRPDRSLARRKPIAEDPLLNTADPTGVADPDAWRDRLRDVIEREVRPAMAHVPRHDP